MASTRNKNTQVNYNLEQKQYSNLFTYTSYKNSQYGEAYNTKLPGNGLNPGQIPWNQLSHNAPDIESFLLGINSTNLVSPASILVPELKTLQCANIFEKKSVLMPEPLVIEKNQRPLR